MANIKSAKKRILVIQTKTARNKSIKSKVKTYVKKVETAIAQGDKEAAASGVLISTFVTFISALFSFSSSTTTPEISFSVP